MKYISEHEMEQNMNLKKFRTYTQTPMEHLWAQMKHRTEHV